MAKQNVMGVDLVHDMAGLVGDLDCAMQQVGSFAYQGATCGDGLLPRGFRIGKFLAIAVPGEGGAFPDMKEIAWHGVGFAVLFIP
jgi:hypothetical protein